ncbi:MAG TPA: universal stress protein [Candidatus Obscuribacterales bacterium]
MKILVAVDERACGEALADFIGSHVWPVGADFKVFHVIKQLGTDDFRRFLRLPLVEDIADELRSSGEHLVRRVAIALRDALHTSHVEEQVVEGDPRTNIVGVAKEWGADLIVVGSHAPQSAGGLPGTVSMAVVSGAPCSVLVLRSAPTPKETDVMTDIDRKPASRTE